jgi:hypothetical protein
MTKFVGFEYFFGPITGRRNKSRPGITEAKWKPLVEDIHFERINWTKGTEYKMWETENFGYVAFKPDTLTAKGTIPNKRIFRF